MLATTLSYLFPGIDFMRDCRLQDDGAGPYIAAWNRPEPQPTPEQIEAARPAAEAWGARKQIKPITPAQLQLALLQLGLLDEVEAFVAQAPRATKIAYNQVLSFERDNPLLQAAAVQFGLDDAAMDNVFHLAASIIPGA